ncbi:hypothetical protein ACRAWF_06395 [Streptomyces sp. L7]
MLAHFKTTAVVESHGHDHEPAGDPPGHRPGPHHGGRLSGKGLPHWISRGGRGGRSTTARSAPYCTPDLPLASRDCRVVGETPKTLENMGCTRLTLVLREARRTPPPRPCRWPRRRTP